MNVVSLFSGIGGLDKGFSDNGFDVIWANDFDKYAVETYRRNYRNKIVQGDINQIGFDEIPDFDVLIGGFPCQPFSMMGEQLGFKEARGTLFFRVAEIIQDKINRKRKPKAIILENVKGLKTHNHGITYATILHVLQHELGYKVFCDVLNSADYGVPQTRNRTYIVCFSNENADFIFPEKQPLTITLSQLLEDNVAEKYYLSNKIKKTVCSNGTGGYVATSEINLAVARPLCATMAKMHRACQDNYVSDQGHRLAQIGNLDEERIRRLTPRECARLQGFEDTFSIENTSDCQLYKQFGNAVTVNVSRAVARSVRHTLEVLNEWN
ncbi:MAG: DNA (cytosine-5-)-methyltransferase [Treponemataceae bacterium]|nr:DNA (cytosine-5-)-methyltransferase [Treponemataceae bacterium]